MPRLAVRRPYVLTLMVGTAAGSFPVLPLSLLSRRMGWAGHWGGAFSEKGVEIEGQNWKMRSNGDSFSLSLSLSRL